MLRKELWFCDKFGDCCDGEKHIKKQIDWAGETESNQDNCWTGWGSSLLRVWMTDYPDLDGSECDGLV